MNIHEDVPVPDDEPLSSPTLNRLQLPWEIDLGPDPAAPGENNLDTPLPVEDELPASAAEQQSIEGDAAFPDWLSGLPLEVENALPTAEEPTGQPEAPFPDDAQGLLDAMTSEVTRGALRPSWFDVTETPDLPEEQEDQAATHVRSLVDTHLMAEAGEEVPGSQPEVASAVEPPATRPASVAELFADLPDEPAHTPEPIVAQPAPVAEATPEPEPQPEPIVEPSQDELEAGAALVDDWAAGLDVTIASVPTAHTPTPVIATRSAVVEEQHVLFTLADTEYAVPLSGVVELSRPPRVTPLPHVPDWLRGVANLRGDIVSLVHLRSFLGLEGGDSNSSRLLVTRASSEPLTTGLLVDRVKGIQRLRPDQIAQPAAPIDNRITPYMRGVCECEDRLVVVLELDRLLLSPEMRQFQAV